MSLLEMLARPESWERFYEYKTSLACPKDFEKALRRFIDGQAYLPVCERIAAGEPFPLPKKAVISKMHNTKKRTVYTYPFAENTVLKLLTFLLLRKYDGIFSPNLYSFRPGRSAADAVRALQRAVRGKALWAYKVDIHNYFNSVPVDRLLPRLQALMPEDPSLFAFLASLLTEPRVREGDAVIAEEKGIMAGTPLSAFYANLYLRELDAHFEKAGVPYARYSDDIILFAEKKAALDAHAACIREHLTREGLEVNPAKEEVFAPEDGWVFLGFSVKDGLCDIAPASVGKLKAKMRRKTRALLRWAKRGEHEGEKAAAAFIRIFNRKLLESAGDNELTWSHWFFSVINTTESLHRIDLYAQDCLRVLISGKHTKARYNVRYEDLKRLGYRSLVHAYYDFDPKEKT